MPIKGVKAVKQNMKRVFKDISDKKAPQFVSAVLSIGENHSKELAPLAYSTLVNSIIKNVNVSNTSIVGVFSYNTKYAAALEFRAGWKPKPPPKYANKKKGIKSAPAWNPQAKPHFLLKGFEDQTSLSAIKKAEDIFRL